ncbi:MAG: hypothetical protein KGI98_03155 [Euryarchaeota archaeon]|nr:hypothetical protein [Euryarchaeota archaeon]
MSGVLSPTAPTHAEPLTVSESSDGVPPELLAFLTEGGGRSLSIRGRPGTGKTSLALEMLARVPGRRFFLSTRVDQMRLFKQFPFLTSRYERIEVVDLASMRAERLLMKSDVSRVTSLVVGNPGPSSKVDLGRFLTLPPPVQELYSRTPEGPGRATVVIDSWEALLADYASRLTSRSEEALSEPELAEALISMFVGQGTNVILVRETADPNAADYLVDGVLEARREVFQDHVFRALSPLKLRGVGVGVADFPFTLHGGRFQFLGPTPSWRAVPHSVHRSPEPVTGGPVEFTWGHRQMDERLAPLYPGALVFLETVANASGDTMGRIDTHIGSTNGHRGLMVTVVLPQGLTPSVIRPEVEPDGKFPQKFRIIWSVPSRGPSPRTQFQVPAESLVPYALDGMPPKEPEELAPIVAGEGAGPAVVIASTSMLAAMAGRDEKKFEPFLSALIQTVRARGGLLVLYGYDYNAGSRFLTGEASHHLRIFERDGLPLLEEVHHGKPLYAIRAPRDPRSFPIFELVPVL